MGVIRDALGGIGGSSLSIFTGFSKDFEKLNFQKLNFVQNQSKMLLKYVLNSKFWPTVRRVDEAFGDRNLVCSCPSVNEYSKAHKSMEKNK